MKLYNLPGRPDKPIKIYGLKMVRDNGKEYEGPIYYRHIDGMYSYCTIDEDDNDGKGVIHLSASTPLVEYKDGYKVDSEDK